MKLGSYELGPNDTPENGIYCGRAEYLMASLPPHCIDLVVTSPPYDNLRDYEGYTFDFEAMAEQLWRVMKDGGVIVWVVGDATIDGSETGTSFRQALHFMELGFNLYDTMIYMTDKPPMNACRYQACFEYMFVISKGRPNTFNPLRVPATQAGKVQRGNSFRQPDGRLKKNWKEKRTGRMKIKNSIWYYHSGGHNYHHPAPFPEPLARDHIRSWSNPGDIVFDPMVGSGTVAKMAVETSRQYLGFDISDNYCEVARKRVMSARVPLFEAV